MTVTKSHGAAASARPGRKSPLRAATLGGMAPAGSGLTTAEILTAGARLRREALPAPDLRRMQISEFTVWLRSRTNKHHRPFQADTIAAYADAAEGAVWSGWVGIGQMTGFGEIRPLPGIWDSLYIDAAVSSPSSVTTAARRRPGWPAHPRGHWPARPGPAYGRHRSARPPLPPT
jgi:hypothetical protein